VWGLCRGLIRRIKAPKYITIRIFLLHFLNSVYFQPNIPHGNGFSTTTFLYNYHMVLQFPLLPSPLQPYSHSIQKCISQYRFSIWFSVRNKLSPTELSNRNKTVQNLSDFVPPCSFQPEIYNVSSYLMNNLISHNLLSHHSSLISYLISFPKSLTLLPMLFVILLL